MKAVLRQFRGWRGQRMLWWNVAAMQVLYVYGLMREVLLAEVGEGLSDRGLAYLAINLGLLLLLLRIGDSWKSGKAREEVKAEEEEK